jgi:hypothetical protein
MREMLTANTTTLRPVGGSPVTEARCAPRATSARDEIVLRVVIVNGLAAIFVHDRLRAARHCHDQDRDTASHVRGAGCSGCSGLFAGFRDSAAGLDRRVAHCDLGSVSLGAGLAWPGYRLWHAPFTCGREDSRAKEFWRPWIRRLHDLRHLVESAHESLWLPRGSLGHCPRLCRLSRAGSDSPFQARS